MKIRELLEGNVSNIFSANTSSRTYGANGFTSILDALANKREITPVEATPTLKPVKQLRPATLLKALASQGYNAEPEAQVTIFSTLNCDTPCFQFEYYYPRQQDVNPAFEQRMREVAQAKFMAAVIQLFGRYATKIETRFGGQFLVYVSDEYIAALDKFTRVPVVTDMITKILEQQNIGGLNFINIVRIKSGYSVRIEGAELVDEKSQRTLMMAIRAAFGDCFIKMKCDGEIDSIGQRPAPDGVTNYRLYFTADLKTGRKL